MRVKVLLISVGYWTFYTFQCLPNLVREGLGREDEVVRCFVVPDGVELADMLE